LWAVNVGLAMAFVARSMIMPMVPLYGLHVGSSPAVIGLLVAAAQVLPLFLAIPTGSLVDRWGVKGLMTAGAVSMVLAPLGMTVWPSIAMLAGVQVVSGMAHLVLVVTAQSYVASLGTGRQREVNFGWYTTSISAGQLVGPLVAGILIDSTGFNGAFLVAGLVAIAPVILSRLLSNASSRVATDPRHQGGSPRSHRLRQMTGMLQNRGVSASLVTSMTIVLVITAFAAFLPVRLDIVGFSATSIGLFLSFKAFVAMMVRPFMPRIIELLAGRYRTLIVMLVSVGIGIALTAFAVSPVTILLCGLLLGIGAGVAQPLSMVLVVDHVADHERGLVLGIRLTFNRLAQMASPVLLGLVAEVFGFTALFLAAGLFAAAGVGVLVLWREAFKRSESALP